MDRTEELQAKALQEELNLEVLDFDGMANFTVRGLGDIEFEVQLCPVQEFNLQMAQGDLPGYGLYMLENEPPRLTVDGEEYVVLRQW